MAAHPDTFLLGYCDDTRALLAHLDAEAPWRAAHVRLLDRDPATVRALRANGMDAAAVDLLDIAALRAEALDRATRVVVFAERVGGSLDRLEREIRTVCPTACVTVVPRAAGARGDTGDSSLGALRVVASWRFWALVGVAIVDGVTFIVPVTPLALVAGALVRRDWLRAAARFLEDLAEAR
jgi:hypothetical protein